MPRLFQPLTVGFDWEMWVVDRGGVALPERALAPILDRAQRAAPSLPLGLDIDQLELRSGICRSADELRGRAHEAFSAAQRAARAHRRRLYTFSGHALVRNFAGGHVHTGSAFDLERAQRLRLALVEHVPTLIAIAAASPVACLGRRAFVGWGLPHHRGRTVGQAPPYRILGG